MNVDAGNHVEGVWTQVPSPETVRFSEGSRLNFFGAGFMSQSINPGINTRTVLVHEKDERAKR